MQLGNSKWESAVFNSRLQPTQIALGNVENATDQLKLNFTYNTTGQNDNNGNVLSQTITVPTVGATTGFTAVQTYTYDSLNRIKDAKENINGNQTPEWKQTFLYDRYGNRRFDTTNNNTTTLQANCPVAVCNPEIDPATNKLVGYQFDASGNTSVDAENRQFIYDAENKQVEVRDSANNIVGKYYYDGDGKRVKKISNTETTIFVYNAGGQLVAEYSTNISQTPQVSYLTNDHLGSPRITTDANGQVVSRRDFQPFGEEIARASYGTDAVRQKFTGYLKDKETDLDYAKARMFGSSLGRFTTPDPYKIVVEAQVEDEEKARAKLNQYLSKPQQWNPYVYTINNPLKYTDPTGEIVLLRGETEEERKAELERIKGIIGEKASSYLSISKDNRFVFVTEVNQHGFALALNNTAHEKDISKIMGGILSSSATVEFKITRTFSYKKNGKELKVEDIREDRAGAVTVPAKESLSGNIQIFVHPLASDVASQKAPFGKPELSSDNERLKFQNNSIVDAHEFGHAYDELTGQEGNWRTMENALREKHNVTQRRKNH